MLNTINQLLFSRGYLVMYISSSHPSTEKRNNTLSVISMIVLDLIMMLFLSIKQLLVSLRCIPREMAALILFF